MNIMLVSIKSNIKVINNNDNHDNEFSLEYIHLYTSYNCKT